MQHDGDVRVHVALGKAGVKDIFKLKELPDAQTLTKLAEPWRPYRNFEAWVSLAQPGTVGASRGGVILQ